MCSVFVSELNTVIGLCVQYFSRAELQSQNTGLRRLAVTDYTAMNDIIINE
jgi:hypothetical protein